MFPLTSSQLKIVNHIEGALLITAGPGSGKTRVLTERIINLLNQNKKRILALTFSNKAAEEISLRLEKSVDEELFESVFVGTIHSFCLDVVLNKGNLIGLPSGLTIFEGESDRIDILKKVFIELPDLKEIVHKGDSRNLLNTCLSEISRLKQEFISPDILLDSNLESDRQFSRIYEAYNNMMLSQKFIDFDDILFYGYKIFTERPQIAKSYTRLYKYIFVDEAQDLNEAQYKIIKALCIDFSNIMMVGDPAQSIYGFNGSDSNYMTGHFKNDFNPKEYELNENFRSTRKIIEAAKKIQVSSNSNAVYPLEGELLIQSLENENDEAEWIVNKIKNLIDYGSKWVEEVSYENIAIIARNRYIFSTIESKLIEQNIPINLGTSRRNVESESSELKIFEAGMRVIINPYDNVHFNQIINLIKYEGFSKEISGTDYLEELLKINIDIIEKVDKVIFKSIQKSWQMLIQDEEGFTRAISLIEDSIHSEAVNLNEDDQYLIQKDLEMWKNHWKKYCSQTVAGQRSVSHFRNQVSLGRTQMYESSGVSLLTVHMSKGLEYEIVFLVGMCQGTFPDYRASSQQAYKEELNNMFVALTRAKRICYLTYPKFKLMPWGKIKRQSPSRFIEMIK